MLIVATGKFFRLQGYAMPIHREVNQDFFKNWSPNMAYVLGFFTADGNMIKNKRGMCFISIEITDNEILEKIKLSMGSNHKIGIRRRTRGKKLTISYRLQIGSNMIFNDLLLLGIMPNKSKIIRLPEIPNQYFAHFVRGYFDGDGSVTAGFFKRSDNGRKRLVLSVRFISGGKLFLEDLKNKIYSLIQAKGYICEKNGCWVLNFGVSGSKKLFKYMYSLDDCDHCLCLDRKKRKFDSCFALC